MINIIMHGCNGKMGQVITKLVADDPDMTIVAGIDPNLSAPNPYPVFPSADECTVDADVIIDFSTAKAVRPLISFAKSKNIPIIICTTGLPSEDLDYIKEVSMNLPVFFSANMSLGVNLLIGLAKRATEILSDAGFDIEIIEKHHNQKIDAPSGTALAIADGINEVLDHQYNYQFDRSITRENRPKKEIGIHAIRGGTIVGEHDVIFAGQDEVITLGHNATSKEVFAVGAIKAAKFMYQKLHSPGLYNMAHLIDN